MYYSYMRDKGKSSGRCSKFPTIFVCINNGEISPWLCDLRRRDKPKLRDTNGVRVILSED